MAQPHHPPLMPGQQAARPENVGILAMEVYFPKCYVSQTKLELKDGCPGKYTRGLGQLGLSFCDDREDVCSLMLSVVRGLLEKYQVDPAAIGRIEVGTETLTDKSKSVKTSLMELLGPGNTDVEGVTSVNACYGGTAALFNSVAWVESSAWDGRYALVVCGDIAVYEAGPARATSGCGAVAMLVGPDAPLVLEPARSSHCMEVWDFYKPRANEYPLVDGKLSQRAYLQSVDSCFLSYRNKAARHFPAPAAGGPLVGSLDGFFDFFCFHSPYHKLAQKGLTRLVYLDFLENPQRPQYQDVQHLRRPELSSTYDDREIDAAFRDKAEPLYRSKLLPAANLPKQIGNCYSASVFMGLASLVHEAATELAGGKRVLMFSYGSGSMASLYTLRGRVPSSLSSPSSPSCARFSLPRMAEALNLRQRLADRIQCSPQQFERALAIREQRVGGRDYHPTGSWPSAGLVQGQVGPGGSEAGAGVSPLQQGAYYLAGVDKLYRRHYARSALL